MSYTIDFLDKKVVATFSGDIEGEEIENAFVNVIENGDIKKLKSIIFNYSNVTSYTVPENFLETVKAFTRFSTSWNKNINAIAVGTNETLKKVNKKLAEHKKELVWSYLHFENLESALSWCNKNE